MCRQGWVRSSVDLYDWHDADADDDDDAVYAYDKILQPDPPGVLNVYRRYNSGTWELTSLGHDPRLQTYEGPQRVNWLNPRMLEKKRLKFFSPQDVPKWSQKYSFTYRTQRSGIFCFFFCIDKATECDTHSPTPRLHVKRKKNTRQTRGFIAVIYILRLIAVNLTFLDIEASLLYKKQNQKRIPPRISTTHI